MKTAQRVNPYLLRIRLENDLRQALVQAAHEQDRGLSSLCRALLREGLGRLGEEEGFLARSVRPAPLRSGTNAIDAQHLGDSEQTMGEQQGHPGIASLASSVESKEPRS